MKTIMSSLIAAIALASAPVFADKTSHPAHDTGISRAMDQSSEHGSDQSQESLDKASTHKAGVDTHVQGKKHHGKTSNNGKHVSTGKQDDAGQ